MSSSSIEALIGGITVFLSVTCTTFICGLFMGGLKAEIRIMSDRLAKIEGMFTLTPRSKNEPDS